MPIEIQAILSVWAAVALLVFHPYVHPLKVVRRLALAGSSSTCGSRPSGT